jgi:hypothetical protein
MAKLLWTKSSSPRKSIAHIFPHGFSLIVTILILFGLELQP